MKFGEKVKSLRNQRGFTQNELSKELGVTLRTIANYEMCVSYPKKRSIYKKLSEILGCDINYLLTEDEEFVLKASESYGKRGENEARRMVSELALLFSGGSIKDEDKDEMMKALQDAYWISKNKKKK